MALPRRSRRLLIAAITLSVLLALAVLLLPSIAARGLMLHYLQEAGYTARIDDIDVNLLTGTVTIENAHGRTERGDGFDIGALRVALDYAPLLSQRLDLSRIELRDSRIDIRRSGDGMRFAGTNPRRLFQGSGEPSNWDIGIQQLAVRDLQLDYRQPAARARPALTRRIVIDDLNGRGLHTRDPDHAVAIDTTMHRDDARLRLAGTFKPFAQPITGALDITTRDFTLDTLAPVWPLIGSGQWNGRLNSDVQTQFSYAADAPLEMTLGGDIQIDDLEFAGADDIHLASPELTWQGQLDVSLLNMQDNAQDNADSVSGNGSLHIRQMDIDQADRFGFQGKATDWTGQATLILASDDAARLTTDGTFRTRALAAHIDNDARFSSEAIDWNGLATIVFGSRQYYRADGQLDTGSTHLSSASSRLDFAASAMALDGIYGFDAGADNEPATLTGTGQLHIDTLDFEQPDTVAMHHDMTDWQGKTTLNVGPDHARLVAAGRLASDGTRIGIPGSATFASSHAEWRGNATVDAGKQLRHRANGQLDMHAAHIAMTDSGVDIDTDRLSFQGQYRLTPAEDGRPGSVSSDGELYITTLTAEQTGMFELQADSAKWQGTSTLTQLAGRDRLATDGTLSIGALRFDIPRTARFRSRQLNWHGHTATAVAGGSGMQANGELDAWHARFDLADTPLAISTGNIVLAGRYRQHPRGPATGPALNADINAQDIEVIQTGIDAAWSRVRQARIQDFTMHGVDAIGFKQLTTRGFRLLEDTHANSSVLHASHASARGFQLSDRQAYRLAALDIDGASIHVLRDDAGMGALSNFFASDEDPDEPSSPARTPEPNAPTFVIESLRMTGPSAYFADTAVTPPVRIGAENLTLTMDDLDTAHPDQPASYLLSADVGEYAHIDSFGELAPFAPDGADIDLTAYLRSLSLPPLSGYLNAAMGRTINRGVANGTLKLAATDGQLDGKLDVTLSNFRVGRGDKQRTEIALGLSMSTALSLVRTGDDNIDFTTLILGDTTYPQFSIRNLVREAMLAGIRTALTSTYTPLGLLDKTGKAILRAFQRKSFRPVSFQPGRFYIPSGDRDHLSRVVTRMTDKPEITLTITGHAVPGEADELSLFGSSMTNDNSRTTLEKLALERARSVRDYIAARGIPARRLNIAEPVVDRNQDASAQVTLMID